MAEDYQSILFFHAFCSIPIDYKARKIFIFLRIVDLRVIFPTRRPTINDDSVLVQYVHHRKRQIMFEEFFSLLSCRHVCSCAGRKARNKNKKQKKRTGQSTSLALRRYRSHGSRLTLVYRNALSLMITETRHTSHEQLGLSG